MLAVRTQDKGVYGFSALLYQHAGIDFCHRAASRLRKSLERRRRRSAVTSPANFCRLNHRDDDEQRTWPEAQQAGRGCIRLKSVVAA
jgi:hypothetical protein